MGKLHDLAHALAITLTAVVLSLSLAACGSGTAQQADSQDQPQATAISRDGSYTSKEDVALYLHTYGELPSNFI